MIDPRFSHLLDELRRTYADQAELQAFCSFPDDIAPQPVTAFHIPAADLLAAETGLSTDARYAALRDAFIAASPAAKWRETYKGTSIGQDFLDRFGCYNLIGIGGAYRSEHIAVWVVYQPPGLYYPWHHHPGEEMYLVLAGQAEFMLEGEPNRVLNPGETARHGSNQPHALQTHDHPVMALVVWRNGFETPPVLTEKAGLA